MSLFTGLAPGLAAAAGGYGQGKLLGEERVYRRQQTAEDRANKKALLDLQRKKLEKEAEEPGFEQKTAGTMLSHYTDRWNTPEGVAFLRENPALGRQVKDVMGHLTRVSQGAEKFDPGRLTNFDFIEDAKDKRGPPGAGAEGAPGAERQIPPGAMIPPGQTQFGYDRALEQMAAAKALPPVTSPSNLGEVRKQAFGAPPLPFQMPTPPLVPGFPRTEPEPTGPPTPGPAAEAPPPSPYSQEGILAGLAAIDAEQPPAKNDLEPAAKYQQRVSAWETARGRRRTAQIQLLGAIPKGAGAAAAVPYVAPTAAAKLEGIGARTEGTRETTRVSKLMTPARLRDIDDRIKSRERDYLKDRDKMTETQRHNKALEVIGKMNADVNEYLKLSREDAYVASAARARFLIEHADEYNIAEDERMILGSGAKVIGDMRGIGGGTEKPVYSQEERNVWSKRMEAVAKKIEDRMKAGKPAPTTTRTTISGGGGTTVRTKGGGDPVRVINGESISRSAFIKKLDAAGLTGPQRAQALSRAGFPK